MGKYATYQRRGSAPGSAYALPPPNPTDFTVTWDDSPPSFYLTFNGAYPPGANCFRMGYKLAGAPRVDDNYGAFIGGAYHLADAEEGTMDKAFFAWGKGYPSPEQASDWAEKVGPW